MTKVIFVVCDGLSDRPIKEFGRLTPLEAARTPNLDLLAKEGICGLVHTIDVGVRPGSDVSHLALFGYDPQVYYTGRGPFEVAGIGMKLEKGDVAFRANVATVNKKLVIIDRRAGRIKSTKKIAALFNGTVIDNVTFLFKESVGHRMGMILRGNGLSYKITDGDPHVTDVKVWKVKPKDNSKEAEFTASVLNKFLTYSYKILKDHPLNKTREKRGLLPANYILVRGAGVVPEPPTFEEKYGLKAACIAGAGLYKGIAKVLGMKVLKVKGATGTVETDILAKFKAAKRALKKFAFVFVHIKACDTLAEDGNFEGKKRFIEKIDKAAKILVGIKNALIVITADHSTACSLKAHTADPVPILIRGDDVRTDEVKSFGERSCGRGRLGHIRGSHVMPIVIDLMGLAQLFGA